MVPQDSPQTEGNPTTESTHPDEMAEQTDNAPDADNADDDTQDQEQNVVENDGSVSETVRETAESTDTATSNDAQPSEQDHHDSDEEEQPPQGEPGDEPTTPMSQSGFGGWFGGITKKTFKTISSTGSELLARPGKKYREYQSEYEERKKRIQELSAILSSLRIEGSPLCVHSQVLALRAGETGRLIGSDDDNDLIKVSWYRCRPKIAKTGTEEEGTSTMPIHYEEMLLSNVNAGFYQPSVDDVDCLMKASVTFLEKSIVSIESFKASAQPRKHEAVFQEGALVTDQEIKSAADAFIREGHATFRGLGLVNKPLCKATLEVTFVETPASDGQSDNDGDAHATKPRMLLTVHRYTVTPDVAKDSQHDVKTDDTAVLLVDGSYPQDAVRLCLRHHDPTRLSVHVTELDEEGLFCDDKYRLQLCAGSPRERDIIALTVRGLRQRAYFAWNAAQDQVPSMLSLSPMSHMYDYPTAAQRTPPKVSPTHSSSFGSGKRFSLLGLGDKRGTNNKHVMCACKKAGICRALYKHDVSGRPSVRLCGCECMYPSVYESLSYQPSIPGMGVSYDENGDVVQPEPVTSMKKSMSSLLSSALDPLGYMNSNSSLDSGGVTGKSSSSFFALGTPKRTDSEHTVNTIESQDDGATGAGVQAAEELPPAEEDDLFDLYGYAGYSDTVEVSVELAPEDGLGMMLATKVLPTNATDQFGKPPPKGAAVVYVTGFSKVNGEAGAIQRSGMVRAGDALVAVNGSPVEQKEYVHGRSKGAYTPANLGRVAELVNLHRFGGVGRGRADTDVETVGSATPEGDDDLDCGDADARQEQQASDIATGSEGQEEQVTGGDDKGPVREEPVDAETHQSESGGASNENGSESSESGRGSGCSGDRDDAPTAAVESSDRGDDVLEGAKPQTLILRFARPIVKLWVDDKNKSIKWTNRLSALKSGTDHVVSKQRHERMMQEVKAESLKEGHAKAEAQFNKQMEKQEQIWVQDAKRETARLNAEIQRLCAELQQDKNTSRSALVEKDLMIVERDNLRGRVEALEGEKMEAKVVKEALETRSKEAETANEELQEQVRKLEKQIQDLSSEGESWSSNLSTKEEALRAIEADYQAAKLAKEQIQSVLDGALKARDELQEKVDERDAELAKLTEENAELAEHVVQAQDEADRLTSRIREVTEESEQVRAKSDHDLNKIREEIADMQKKVGVAETHARALKESAEAADARAAEEALARQSAESYKEDARLEVEKAHALVEEAKADAQKVQDEMNRRLREDAAKKERDEELQRALSEAVAVREENSRMLEESTKTKTLNKSLKAKVQSMAAEVGKMAQFEAMQEELDDAIVKCQLERASRMEMEDELKAYKRALREYGEQAKKAEQDRREGRHVPVQPKPKIFDHLYKTLLKEDEINAKGGRR